MKKLILAFLTLVAVMALCLTSCEGDKTPDKDETPEPHTHTASEWITDTEPTCKVEGTKHKECTECEEVLETGKVDKLEHNYSTEFVFNATHHYYECTCGLRSNEATHISSGAPTSHNDEVCTVCGYVINEAVGIKFNTLNVNGNKVNGKVSNDTEYYTFIGEITTVGGATYIISDNISGKDPIVAQTIDLVTGDNTVYVIEFIDEEPTNIYIVTIRRRPMHNVTFNTVGGTAVEHVTVEEDTILTAPQTTRAGYTFAGWDYDFTQPITQSFTATASWTAHTDTKYVVEYYLENVTKTDYDLDHTDTLYDVTDTTANAEQKTLDHFTLNTQKSTLSGNIDGEGKLVLKVYYTRDTYTVSTDSNNTNGGTVTSGGTYAYDKEITLTASTNAGYTFLGWFEGETKVSSSLSYTFSVDHSATYTAKWEANTDTKYVVEYYLENVTKTDYDLDHTDTLYDVTDTTANAEQKTFDHFTLNTQKSTLSGNIDGEGKLVLKVYYTRNVYTVTLDSDCENAGTFIGEGMYAYGTIVTITAQVENCYRFLGWYKDENIIANVRSYSFNIEHNVTFVAKCEVIENIIDYILDGGIIPDDAPVVYDKENGTLLPTVAIRDGFVFGGWYREAELVNRVYYVPAGYDEPFTVYAKWLQVFVSEDYDTTGTEIDVKDKVSAYKGGVNYNPASYGVSIKTVKENGNTYLLVTSAENGTSQVVKSGSFKTMTETAISYEISVRAKEGEALCKFSLWIPTRGSKYGTLTVASSDASGNFKLANSSKVVAKFTSEEWTTVRVTLDFAAGEAVAYDGQGNELDRSKLTVPTLTQAALDEGFKQPASLAEWQRLEGITATDMPYFIFFYSTGTGSILLDNIKVIEGRAFC